MIGPPLPHLGAVAGDHATVVALRAHMARVHIARVHPELPYHSRLLSVRALWLGRRETAAGGGDGHGEGEEKQEEGIGKGKSADRNGSLPWVLVGTKSAPGMGPLVAISVFVQVPSRCVR